MSIKWITPVEFTGLGDAAFHDIDVSAYVSPSATGVFIHSSCPNAVSYRKNGSTDSDSINVGHFWFGIGLDANKIFEYKIAAGVTYLFYVVGYTEAESSWFTNQVWKAALAGAGAYYDVDISADTGVDTAIAVFGKTLSTYNDQWAVRPNGSTDDPYTYSQGHPFFTPVDASEIFEAKVSAVRTTFALNGYIKSGANLTINVNATNISLAAVGAWTDLTQLPVNATGGMIRVFYASTLAQTFGLRINGSAEAVIAEAKYKAPAYVQGDVNRYIEGYISNAIVDFYLSSYVTTPTSIITGYKSLKGVGM